MAPLLQLFGAPSRPPLAPVTEIDAASALSEERLVELTSALIASQFGTTGFFLYDLRTYLCFESEECFV